MFLKEYEKTIKEIIQRENLICLANVDSIKFDGENSLGFLSLIAKTRNATKALTDAGAFDRLSSDLIDSISLDIQFSLANVYLYHPLANNFLAEIQTYSDGQRLPTYFRKLEDKRFFYYVNCTFEKLYIFWDRIGDILALCFQIDLREKDIYFSKVIEQLSTISTVNSEHWQWLKNFHAHEYMQILNRLRIKIVHYRQKDTYFFHEWLNIVANYQNDPTRIHLLQAEKDELPNLLKHQLELANIGFEKMVRTIKEHGPFEL